ncbi:hypothetical protein A0H81_01991 [Grifola frondosa]|uniref:ubiquitinyl hydrolase 1 n=1 Tax=Grifola frondosa TaxID=5627 RepID=A0A1C7MLG4_GRIFR|nr:hypothetical protein A0H81_01991 [Grifola frondosa]
MSYRIDDTLGRLVGNVSLANKLYKIYLHALTSHCLPDLLAGRTGTEEALHDLHSAGCWSFQSLTDVEEDLLEKIGSLTPVRKCYPEHLRVMQQMIWSNLSPLSQHHEYYSVTRAILEYADRLRVFTEDAKMSSPISRLDSSLLERAALRNCVYYPAEFAYPPSNAADVEYDSRDRFTDTGTINESAVYNTARTVYDWPQRLNTCHEIFDKLRMWNSIAGPGTNSGLTLQYGSHWLKMDMANAWLSLYNLCRFSERHRDRYPLVFVLSALAYASPQYRDLADTLLAFVTCRLFRALNPPDFDSYLLSDGCEPNEGRLHQIIQDAAFPFEESPEATIQRCQGESNAQLARRRYSTYQEQCSIQRSGLVRSFIHQWPCKKPRRPSTSYRHARFNLEEAMDDVDVAFSSWHRNRALRDHVHQVEAILRQVHCSTCIQYSGPYQFVACSDRHLSSITIIPVNVLFTQEVANIDCSPPKLSTTGHIGQERLRDSEEHGELVFHRIYGNNLAESQSTLDQETVDTYPEDIPFTSKYPADHYTQCKDHLDRVVGAIVRSLSPSSTLEEIMFTTCLWPRLTITSLLRSLGSLSGINLTAEWKRALIALANAVISVQRAQRLLGFALGHQRDEFFKELKNMNCDGWDPSLYPDWLLVQIDGHFIVRSIQADVALEMISPTSGENTALQLNMGEGKSSVIVPVIAATLADRTRLVRVVVLKSLANSMFQMLVDRLGGLNNRRVDQVQIVQNLYKECMDVGGILVTQPDHILSFKLMAIDRQLSANDSTSRPVTDQLLESQRWLEKNTRDILDESDEILHVRYQLIYTIGLQRHLEDHPDRWTTIQQVFMLVKKVVPQIQHLFPLGIELEAGPNNTFPSFRILADHAVSQQLRDYCGVTGLWKGLLLLRGLLAHGILVYVLKERRWRVDYGLDQRRSMLAVPYRAKDVPALRAEFGHPDVAIALTCLSYYYGGLQEHQIDLCFALLYKLDNPMLEYETWIHDCDDVPESLRQLNGVNLRSPEQRQQHLLPLFRRNVAVINFFLSHVVFPKEAKEFPQKQVASGWDIAEKKDHVTTGFSGTNDNRYLLPTSITQRDPPHQLCTNAKVLNYLLRPENSSYICAQDVHGERLSVQKFLELLVQQEPEIRVLLDVGAEMLELQNEGLVARWLELNQNAQAAVYFGYNDQLMVLTRNGTVESFVSSPFNQQLDQCILYLDDAHTRGTDVKLPRDVRAAVTLGPKVTKDRLVQGCMRMRKLGNGHSVMFFAPLEIDRSIRKAAKKTDGQNKDLIIETVLQRGPSSLTVLYLRTGLQCRGSSGRPRAWKKCTVSNPPHEHPAFEVVELRQRCMELGVMSLSESRMDEEQEREVDHEVEREQEVERPPKAKAATHRVHPHIKEFIRTGTFPLPSPAIVPAFSNLSASAADQHIGVWSPRLLASLDFSTTIERQGIDKADDYLRPVTWILSSVAKNKTTLVILSPYEVNELLPSIRCSTKVRLHIYTPRVTRAMKPCDDLSLYCILPSPAFWTPPPPLIMQLNIFGGQLYLPDYETYLQTARFLGIYTDDIPRDLVQIQSDGFILPKHRPAQIKTLSPFDTTPLPFLKALLGLRRKGMGYSSTHLGKILRARLLTDDDFDNVYDTAEPMDVDCESIPYANRHGY